MARVALGGVGQDEERYPDSMDIKLFLKEMAKEMNKDQKQILPYSGVFQKNLIETVGELKTMKAASFKELGLPILLRDYIQDVLNL